MRAVIAVLALAAIDDTPAPVTEWLRDARKSAPSLAEIVTPKDGDAPRIVIAGRAGYGTVELARFEGSLALLAKAGDVIALDTGPREAEAIDHWLRTGIGNVEEIVGAAGAFAWSRAEAQVWLAALSRHDEKPKIVGIATGDPKAACTEFLAYLLKIDPTTHPRAEFALKPLTLAGRNGEPRYVQLEDNERTILRMGLEETLGLVRESEEKYVKKSSAAEYARNLGLLVSLKQYEETMRFEREGGEHDPRGRIMAENALAALKSGTEHTRLFAFVGLRDLARASDTDSFAAQLVTLSAPRSLCIGTACGAAKVRAIDPNATAPRAPRELEITIEQATPLERAISQTGADKWILDLRRKPTDAGVTAWLAAHRALRSARTVCGAAGETPWDHDVAGDFDALAWFPSLTTTAR